jgi:hypothetical protein
MIDQEERVRIGWMAASRLIFAYAYKKLTEQIRSVALIVLYLILFQTLVLGIRINDAIKISAGLALVVVGLAFFIEGLLIGLMPLGEIIGSRLPMKSGVITILSFSFILGLVATFAEPAIGVLREAGSSVRPWEAPLLYLILNRHAEGLLYSVGAGVGFAVVAGMLRFLYDLSLKPFLYILIGTLAALTLVATQDPNLRHIVGLAWDCGAVTTGPVTVPLVLALGIGVSRMALRGDSAATGGFGVVTLASLFPVLSVMIFSFALVGSVPKPSSPERFFERENRANAARMFESDLAFKGFALMHSDYTGEGIENPANTVFEDRGALHEFITMVNSNADLEREALGSTGALRRWVVLHGSDEQRLLVFGSRENYLSSFESVIRSTDTDRPAGEVLFSGIGSAVRAILPLVLLLLFVLFFIIRSRVPQFDELVLGIVFALFGMGLFNTGIGLGLTSLGNQVGSRLPVSFTTVELLDESKSIRNFDRDIVQTAIADNGRIESFFYMKIGRDYRSLPFREHYYSESNGSYFYIPVRGPLFGSEMGFQGMLVVILFAFFMGYGATLAEPALNALGTTVEEITIGTFKKGDLIQTVAIGVGLGIAVGVAKIIWNIPLVYLLIPPYLLLLAITFLSSEEFVNIGWDSAGVTTGPITVPLVLAMGLGIGGGVEGVVEGFGILAVASVAPILAVLIKGLRVSRTRREAIEKDIENIE